MLKDTESRCNLLRSCNRNNGNNVFNINPSGNINNTNANDSNCVAPD